MERNFLIVAANGRVREALARSLRDRGYSVTLALSGSEAQRVARGVAVDAVLIEAHLPDMTGGELRTRLLKERPDCRVINLTSFELVRNSPTLVRFGADDYLVKLEQLCELVRAPFERGTERGTGVIAERGNKALIGVIDVLVGLIELDDRFFGGSSHQAMRLARGVAEELSADEETQIEVVLAALLRDVGKVGVEHGVLSEHGSFSSEQKERMKDHVGASLRLFEHIDFPWKVLPIVRHHHERYDGTGYPDGLLGREIPIGARIVAVVDSYLAMTSPREHRPALEPEAALRELIQKAGSQFDPEVVEAFQRVLDGRLAGRPRQGKPRVLLVDPDDNFRKLLKMRLLNEGLEVEEVAECERAVKAILEHAPDLVLVDVDAENGRAFGLLQEIREDESLLRVPFAFLSERDDRVLKIRALRHGVDGFLSKQDDLEELVARVENILTREALRRDGTARRARKGIAGDLEQFHFTDLVQTLVIGMKTACLSLTSGEHSGKIWFENGTARHAQTDGVEGEAAFYAMVRWNTGEFVIEHGVRSTQATLEHDPMFLLMEGLRLMDEDAREDKAKAAL
ncbi:MAG TPA: HD domain-containing phosphohydrolase [Candidatus Polarisedimenticolaceae bacterium]|nr:HD domain-containing phosphohydrolase [Candidatus Polarisedimenticolaceae bacterium]